MSRKVVLLAAMLGAICGPLVLPVSEANAAFCAKPPKLGVHGGDCQKYQCVRRGPCQVNRVTMNRKGCLRYMCTTMVPAGGNIPGKPDDTRGPVLPPKPLPR